MDNYTNLAYDLELFAPKADKADIGAVNRVENIQRKKTKNTRTQATKIRHFGKILFLSIGFLAFIILYINLTSVSSELTAKISSANSEIVELKSEKTRLSMEYERLIAYSNIEQAARELGMQKQDQSQVVYVNGSDSDNAVIVDDDSQNNIFSAFAEWF